MNPPGLTLDRATFESIAASVCSPSAACDRVLLSIAAETSDFVRLNHARVRQATSVRQCVATLSVVSGKRRMAITLSLPDDAAAASAMLIAERAKLIEALPLLPDDPHLLLPDQVVDTERNEPDDELPATGELIAQVMAASDGLDLVGFHAAGPSVRAFADSRGQRNWHRVASFNFDWSLFATGDARDRAVKTAYAGRTFSSEEFARRMTAAREQLALLQRPARALIPGDYRVYLAPPAVAELLQAMSWSGFSRKDRESGTSSLSNMERTAASLDVQVSITEATDEGIAPAFTDTGHIRPARVPLIDRGALAQSLVSPRTAAEFDLASNSGASEYPASLAMAAGALAPKDILTALGDGLLIGNLWYLNYSDRQNARVTGMSRFACFAVESGRIVAPIGVMRFDDALTALFGGALEALTTSADFIPGSSTWGARELSSVSCPGMLLRRLSLTL